jgi:hypothetical protein
VFAFVFWFGVLQTLHLHLLELTHSDESREEVTLLAALVNAPRLVADGVLLAVELDLRRVLVLVSLWARHELASGSVHERPRLARQSRRELDLLQLVESQNLGQVARSTASNIAGRGRRLLGLTLIFLVVLLDHRCGLLGRHELRDVVLQSLGLEVFVSQPVDVVDELVTELLLVVVVVSQTDLLADLLEILAVGRRHLCHALLSLTLRLGLLLRGRLLLLGSTASGQLGQLLVLRVNLLLQLVLLLVVRALLELAVPEGDIVLKQRTLFVVVHIRHLLLRGRLGRRLLLLHHGRLLGQPVVHLHKLLQLLNSRRKGGHLCVCWLRGAS